MGSNVTLTCVIKPDAGTVRWVRGRGQPTTDPVTDEGARYETRLVSPVASQLRIGEVEFADEGAFRCFVGHTFRAPDLYYAEAMLTVHCTYRHCVVT